MRYFSFMVVFGLLSGCGIKHKASGTINTVSAVNVSDSIHTILTGVHPDTINFIEDICNNQDDKPVIECVDELFKVLSQKPQTAVEELINE